MKIKSRRWFHPSTWSFFQEGRHTENYSFIDFLHGYIYGRWPYLYISIGTGEHPLASRLSRLYRYYSSLFPPNNTGNGSAENTSRNSVAESYHGKVVPLESAMHLVTIREPVTIKNLEQVIPYSRARDLILENPDHIIALDCPCRSARANPCLPLDVCLIVGEPFASFVADHHPGRSRWLTSTEAVEILKAEDERGHAHHAFFKDAMLGRFYAICNCCSCCCGAIHAHRNGTPMLASSGYLSSVDTDLCIGCGDCTDFCQFFALTLTDGHAAIDQELCMGCGVCLSHCPQDALSLQRVASKGEPLEITRLLQTYQESLAD